MVTHILERNGLGIGKERPRPTKTSFYARVCVCLCVCLQKPAPGVHKPVASTWCVLRSSPHPSPYFQLCSASLPLPTEPIPHLIPPTCDQKLCCGGSKQKSASLGWEMDRLEANQEPVSCWVSRKESAREDSVSPNTDARPANIV